LVRSHGNENWKFDEDGLMLRRLACIDDFLIQESDGQFRWNRSALRPRIMPDPQNLIYSI
jgi:nuclear transport factor 2 (NTF2) superfamily protein